MNDTPPRKSRTGLIIVVSVLGGSLLLCCLSVGIIGAIGNRNTEAASATATTGPSPTPAPPTTAPKPAKWTAVQTFTGNGNQTTSRFTINADDWRLVWSCDPTSTYFGSYNVAVDVDYADGTPADPVAINTICKADNRHGSTDVQNVTGSVYLSVLSEGAWTINVEVLE